MNKAPSQPVELSPSAIVENDGTRIGNSENTGAKSKIEGDRPCFLFEDNEDDNVNDSNNLNNHNEINARFEAKHKQITTLGNTKNSTPNDHLNKSQVSAPKSLFHPPQEIMIDPLTVPPSPMREPNVDITTSPGMNRRLLDDFHPGIYLNFQESSPGEFAPNQRCLGDPVGDIAMQRQLQDAERLVRIILGRPMNKSHQVLESTSILQAIRSFALMKAELVGLRRKQEIKDDDPPAILQTLGSPAATTPSTSRTGTFSRGKQGLQAVIDSSDSTDGAKGLKNVDPRLPTDAALEQANETIERLTKELAIANDTIQKLREKIENNMEEKSYRNTSKSIANKDAEQSAQNDKQLDHMKINERKHDGIPESMENLNRNKEERFRRLAIKLKHEVEDAQQSTQNYQQYHHQIVVEESKQKVEVNEEGKDCGTSIYSVENVKENEPFIQNGQERDDTAIQESKQDETFELDADIQVDEVGEEHRKTIDTINKIEDTEQLLTKEHDQILLEESKKDSNFDLLLDEIVLIPQPGLTKDIVREKLKLYCQTIARHSSDIEILEMRKKMQQSREESDRRIREIENKMKLQDQEHKKQIQAMTREKERITNPERSKNTILVELAHSKPNKSSDHLSIANSMVGHSFKVEATTI